MNTRVCMCAHLVKYIFIAHSLLQPNTHLCQTLDYIWWEGWDRLLGEALAADRSTAHWGLQESFLLNSPPSGVYIFCFISGIEFSDKHTWKGREKCHGNCLTAFRWGDGIWVPSIWPTSFALEILIRWTYRVVGKRDQLPICFHQ